MKRCDDCGYSKPDEHYKLLKSGRRGAKCRACVTRYIADWREANGGRRKAAEPTPPGALFPPEMPDRACKDLPADVFYPGARVPAPSAQTIARLEAKAKAICAVCPHLDQCRTWAIEHNEQFGVWGGTDARQRAAMRRDLGLVRHGPGVGTIAAPIPHGTDEGWRRHRTLKEAACDACTTAHRYPTADATG